MINRERGENFCVLHVHPSSRAFGTVTPQVYLVWPLADRLGLRKYVLALDTIYVGMTGS